LLLLERRILLDLLGPFAEDELGPFAEDEVELRQRLFYPLGAVVVERGDPVRRGHEIRAALGCHTLDEVEDRLLGLPSLGDGRLW